MSNLTQDDFGSALEIDADVPVLIEMQGKQLGRVQNGPPEVTKNSSDQAIRMGILDREKRPIIIAVDIAACLLLVLDFFGAFDGDQVDNLRTWGHRTASTSHGVNHDQVEGGNDTGGSSFAVFGAVFSVFVAVYNGMRTVLGFVNTDGPDFGGRYSEEGGQQVKDLPEPDPRARLDEVLEQVALTYDDLPESARDAFEERQSFSAFSFHNVHDWKDLKLRKRRKEIEAYFTEDYLNHSQTQRTIAENTVFLAIDGQFKDAPLALPALEPMVGFENQPRIPIPETLIDPLTGDPVAIGTGDNFIQFEVSAKPLQGERGRQRNRVNWANIRNQVADIPSRDIVSCAGDYIRGQLKCESLDDSDLLGADRRHLDDTPRVRALTAFLKLHGEPLSQEVRKNLSQTAKPDQVDKANETVESLGRLMEDFLKPDEGDSTSSGPSTGGVNGTGTNIGPGGVTRKRPLKGNNVTHIDLEPKVAVLSMAAGATVDFRYALKEIDPVTGERRYVTGEPVTLQQSGSAVLSLCGRKLTADSAGRSDASLEHVSGVSSRTLPIESVKCSGAAIGDPGQPLVQGKQVKLPITYHTPLGDRSDLVSQLWVSDPKMATVGRGGMITPGYAPGDIQVFVRYGAGVNDVSSTTLVIGDEMVIPKAKSGTNGKGPSGSIPRIVVCGTDVPTENGMETHVGGPDYDTIIHVPAWEKRGILWMNVSSEEATHYREACRRRNALVGINSPPFQKFMAGKLFELLYELRMAEDLEESALRGYSSMMAYRVAKISAKNACMGFLPKAYTLIESLNKSGKGTSNA